MNKQMPLVSNAFEECTHTQMNKQMHETASKRLWRLCVRSLWRTSLKKHSITQFFRVFFNNGGFEMILCFLEEDEDEEWNVEWRKWCVYCLSRGFSMGLWEENGEMKRSEWRALFAILVFWEVEEACSVHFMRFIATVTSQPQQINAFFFNFCWIWTVTFRYLLRALANRSN